MLFIIFFAGVFADEEAQTFTAEFEVLKEAPERTIGVDCYEILENNSFEMLSDGGKGLYGYGWTSHLGRDYTYLGCGFIDRSTDAHTGEYSVHVKLGANEYCNIGPNGAVIPGETYEASVYVKRLQDGGDARMFVNFSGSANGVNQNYSTVKMLYDDVTPDKGWVKKTVRFVAPPHAQTVTLWNRFNGPGEILYDDFSLLCITDEMPVPEMLEKKPAIESIEIIDADFEKAKVGQPLETISGWDQVNNPVISNQYAHSGKQSVELKNVDGGGDAIGTRYLKNLKEGATYQVSAWFMNPSELKIDMGFWMHWSEEENYTYDVNSKLGIEKPRWRIPTNFEWTEYIAEFTVPEGARSAMLYFRHRLTPGSIFMDDVEIYMVKAPKAIKADTDEVFYYTEWKTGKVTCQPYAITEPANSRAEFTFIGLSGEILDMKTVSGLDTYFEYEFSTSFMAQKGERYHVNIKIFGANDVLLQEETFPVYRYDRPTYLGADGVFRKNGKEIVFTLGSGLNMNNIDLHPEKGGITVAQLIADNPGVGLEMEERLDAYYEQGMFVMLNCYSNGKSAGHPDNIDATKILVEKYKDHPAIFGWKLHDEPYQKGVSTEEMIAGYKAIRDIDPNHPVYIDDSPVGSYEWLFKFCDIFECDYYGGADANGGRIMTDIMDKVKSASKGRKPYSILLLFFDEGYFPSYEELRHMTYQSFFSGGVGYGYHTLEKDTMTVRPEWQEIVEKWAPWERNFAIGCFVTGEYTFVNYQKTNDILWGTFTDGKNIYVIALNRDKNVKNTAEIPLTDGAGTFEVGAFTAKTMTSTSKSFSGTGTLVTEIDPFRAEVWKVTPTEGMLDVSHLKNASFKDVMNYSWAYNAIANLEEKGIVNRVSEMWYGPEQNITRSDYAMFLVRTLGLTDGAGENFLDVDPNAEYAKELAIGKAAGIINGVGDNKFNPEAQITRQDMMTMTSRALSLAGSTDLGAFSDSGNIADYATAHVSAMVAEGLIKGNADGTINPLGNTTRAEAAVIMQRILDN